MIIGEIIMKSTKRLICLVLVASMLVTGMGVAVALLVANGSLGVNTPGTDLPSDADLPVDDGVYPMEVLSSSSFFEDQFTEIDVSEGEYINKTYEKFPVSQNKTNLQSHATATYANINGETVMADAFYRQYNEALNDPNVGLGLLLYQCIQYKIKNPETDVEVCFSSYRTSPTIAVCVVPESRYYGYMRSLYGNGNDYDENGFVRIAYMLVEAAKLGIKVTIVGQLNSYGVKQYNDNGELKTKAESSYVTYFTAGLEQDCYPKYAEGKKVSDFMTFRQVEWTLADKGGTDMMHVKALTASHYLSTDGVEYENAVFLTSSNLDAIDYKGCNGNNGAQSGVVVTGHERIYNASINYIKLMAEYYEQEKLYEFRHLVNEVNTEQAQLILAGRGDEIALEDQLIYLGSDSDKVFKLYFSPLPGDVDAWDTDYNPYCEHSQNLYESSILYPDEYIVYTYNCASYTREFNVSQTMSDMVNYAFNTMKNPENRLSIQAKNYDYSELEGLVVGEDLGFKYLKNKSVGIHSKDILFSYIKDDERKYVSLLSSCNFHSGALYYQTNSMMTITETDETGNVFYMALGKVSTAGAVTDNGRTFSENERYYMTNKLSALPQTAEFTLTLDGRESHKDGSYGKLLSNYDFWHSHLSYEIAADGHPQVSMWIRSDGDNVVKLNFLFDKVDVRTGKELTLTIVHDRENAQMLCYVDGELKQTVKQAAANNGTSPVGEFETKQKFVVGGDWMGSNSNYFTGVIRKLSLWKDMRSAEEIAVDITKNKPDVTDTNLLASYNMHPDKSNPSADVSYNANHLKKETLWQNIANVTAPKDYAYSFAVIGDMQELSEEYFNDHYIDDKLNSDPYDGNYTDGDTDPSDNKPEYVKMLVDWLIENKDSQKIAYVMGLGDITQKSYTAEWDYAKEQFYRLDGIIPFSLARGNHDKVEPQIIKKVNGKKTYPEELQANALYYQTFNNDVYLSQMTGCYKEGDVANTYRAFEVCGTKYLHICFDYGPSDDVLQWAGKLIEKYSDHRVIITTHTYMFRDGTTLDKNDAYPASKSQGGFNDGDDMWNKLISKYENIFLVMSGHDPWDHIVCTRTNGDNGNTVTQLLIDPQNIDSGLGDCAAMVAMLYFSEDGKTVEVRYFSVARNQYGSMKSQFSFTVK